MTHATTAHTPRLLVAGLALAALLGALLIPAGSQQVRAEDPPSTASPAPADGKKAEDKEPTIDPALKLRIQAWIRRLGNEDFNKREEAAARLVEIGSDALYYLRQAAKSADETAAAGAKKAIADIEAAIKKANPDPGQADPSKPARPRDLMPGASEEQIDAFIREQLDRIQREFERQQRDGQSRTPRNSMSIIFTESGKTYRYLRREDGSFEVTVSTAGDPKAITRQFQSEGDMASQDPDLHQRWMRNKPREFNIRIPGREQSEDGSAEDRMRRLDEEIDRMLEDILGGKPGQKPDAKVPNPSQPPLKQGLAGWENTLAAGARCMEVEAPLREQLGISPTEDCVQIGGFVNHGLLLETAGVKQFDIVFAVRVGGETYAAASPAALRDALAKVGEGALYDVVVMRRGARQTLTAKR